MSSSHGDQLRRELIPRRVFLSHTAELRRYPETISFVAAAEQAISRSGDAIIDMAYFPPNIESPAATCREQMAKADVFVIIAGFRFGSPVQDQPNISYTELEYRIATELNIPRLVFLLDEHSVGPAIMFFEPEHAARQLKFRAHLMNSGVTAVTVRNPSELETRLSHALRELQARASADLSNLRASSLHHLGEVTKQIRAGNFTKAEEHLGYVRGVAGNLTVPQRLRFHYESACVASLQADVLPKSSERDRLLSESFRHLSLWLELLLSEDQAITEKEPAGAVYAMTRDNDLHSVLKNFQGALASQMPPDIRQMLPDRAPKRHDPTGGGCFPAGTLVQTPAGEIPIEFLREGELVTSVALTDRHRCFYTTIRGIHTRREVKVVIVNDLHVMTGSQPVCTNRDEYTAARDLLPGMSVLTSNLAFVPIRRVSTRSGYFPVYSLTTDHETHNYIVAGLVCHNAGTKGN